MASAKTAPKAEDSKEAKKDDMNFGTFLHLIDLSAMV
jgi:hypothetical protein